MPAVLIVLPTSAAAIAAASSEVLPIPGSPAAPVTLTGVPRELSVGSLGGALGVANSLGTDGTGLASAAKEAWVSGFKLSLLVGAVVVGVAALIANRFLPDQAHDLDAHGLSPAAQPVDEPIDEPVGDLAL